MELYLDSANLESIKRMQYEFPLDGVTTNPAILAREERKDWENLLKEIRALIPKKKLFVQVPSLDTALEMATKFKALVGEPLVIKVPMIEGGAHIIHELDENGFSVCGTAIYTPLQAYMAAKAGADYVAPYVSHISKRKTDDNTSKSGCETAVEMQKMLVDYGFSTKVLGASFRTFEQVEKVWLEADHIEAVTLTEDLMVKLEQNDGTNSEMARFEAAWESIN